MKNPIMGARFSASHLAWLAALAVLAVIVIWAYRVTSSVALVDGWAVLNRIMHFQHGDLTLEEYLFRPHGAHLHSIVYAISWLDFRYFGGAQTLTQLISLTATALFGFFFVCMIVREGERRRASRVVVVLGCAAAMAAICSMADLEIMMHPFQVVLSVSRLTYILLLYAVIVGILEERVRLYAVAMVLSLLAVTFHGTGYVFALCVLGAHVLVCRRVWMAVASVTPLLSAIIVQNLFPQGGGELSHLDQALNLRSLVGILPAMAAYFASPLASLGVNVSNRTLLSIGFVLFCAVTFLTVRAVFTILGLRTLTRPGFWQQLRAARSGPRADSVEVFLAVIGSFLLASSVAATLFWVIRTAADPHQLPPSYYLLGSGRYGAFACLAFVIVVVALLRSPDMQREKPMTVFKLGGILATASLLGMAFYASLLELRIYDQDDKLNIAAAGILTGIKPTKPETEAVWEGARDDPYWVRELPATADFMRAERKGLWYRMPQMGARGGAFYAGHLISDLVRMPVASDDAVGRCAISGTVPANEEFDKKGRVLALANADGVVIGYGALLRVKPAPNIRTVRGFARCTSGVTGNEPLFLAHDMRTMAALTAASESAALRGSGMLPVTPLSDMKGALQCTIDPGVVDKGPTAVLTLTNQSDFEWTLNTGHMPIGVGVHLLDSKGSIVYWDKGLRVPAAGVIVEPHASAVLRLPIDAISLEDADAGPGTRAARFELVQDRHAWFTHISCDAVVSP